MAEDGDARQHEVTAEPDARAVLDAVADIVLIADAEGQITYVNAAAASFGWEPAVLVGTSGFDLIHPDDLGLAAGAYEHTTTREGAAIPIELRVLTASGEWRSCEMVANNQMEGPLAGVVLSIRDITQRSLYEQAVRHNPESLRAMINRVADLLLFVTADGRVRYANGALTRVLGWDPEVVIDHPLTELLAADTTTDDLAAVHELLTVPGRVLLCELPFAHSDGRSVPVEISGTNLLTDLVIGGTVLTARDLTPVRKAEQEFRRVLGTLEEAFVVFDGEGRAIYANQSAERHLAFAINGRVDDHLEGLSELNLEGMLGLAAALVDEHGEPVPLEDCPPARAVLLREPFDQTVFGFPKPDGSGITWLTMRGTVLDVDGQTQVILSGFDVTPLKRLERDLRASEARFRDLSMHDPLTGLANNRLVDDRLDQAVARRDAIAGVLFLDLDHFKAINDTHGHAAGDLVLTTIADRLRASVRAGDTPGRRGGDEFVVVCDGITGTDELASLAQRVSDAIRRPIELDDGTELRATGSIGGAMQGGGVSSADDLLTAADTAVYEAKAAGRDCWRLA